LLVAEAASRCISWSSRPAVVSSNASSATAILKNLCHSWTKAANQADLYEEMMAKRHRAARPKTKITDLPRSANRFT
jgi:hypothetical protein